MTEDRLQVLAKQFRHNGFHAFNSGSGSRQPRSFLHPDVHAKLAGFRFWHKLGSYEGKQQSRSTYKNGGQHNNRPLHFQYFRKETSVAFHLN